VSPGVLEHARGFETPAEALYLRGRILRQLQLACAIADTTAQRVLGQRAARLARRALDRVHRRGVDVRLGATIAEVASDHLRLADGEIVPAETVVLAAGVAPPPLICEPGLPVERGCLVVDDQLRAPGAPARAQSFVRDQYPHISRSVCNDGLDPL
jgi:NADH:quinone reductase (non-electrogenic)